MPRSSATWRGPRFCPNGGLLSESQALSGAPLPSAQANHPRKLLSKSTVRTGQAKPSRLPTTLLLSPYPKPQASEVLMHGKQLPRCLPVGLLVADGGDPSGRWQLRDHRHLPGHPQTSGVLGQGLVGVV